MKYLHILVFLVCTLANSYGEEKPNILFIFADDHCYSSLGAVKGEVETPNLDRLAKRSTVFTQAYNMGAWQPAVCMASRQMIITGRHLWSAYNKLYHMKDEVKQGHLWPQLMSKAGYKTYMSGKWHIKAKAEDLFDVTQDVRGGMPNQTEEGYNRPLSPEDYQNGWKPWEAKYEGFWKGGKHWSEVLADHSIDFLKDASKSEKPFFMYLAFNAPHDPRQAPKSYVDKYPASQVKIPANFLPEYPYKDEIGCSASLRDEKLAPFPRSKYSIQVNRQEYYALITHMDNQIGRILDTLEKSGKAENTYIIYTADHGLSVGQHGLLGKQNMYEHSIRVPFFIAGPDIEKGKYIETPIYLQDVMPTCLELAKVKKPDYVDFKSLLPLTKDETTSHYDRISCSYTETQHMVRKGDYKLISYPKANKFRLFNIENDPWEMHDLIQEPSQKSKIQELKVELAAYLKTVNGGKFPDLNPNKKR